MPSADPPDIAGDPRTHTECYARGAGHVHTALLHDIATARAIDPTPDDAWAIPAPHPHWAVPPFVAMYAAPDTTEPVAPKSTGTAARLPDYDAPFGWKVIFETYMLIYWLMNADDVADGGAVGLLALVAAGKVGRGEPPKPSTRSSSIWMAAFN